MESKTPEELMKPIEWSSSLIKMMKESQAMMFERKPSWGTGDTCRAQISVMDAFIKHIAPLIKSQEDMKAFIEMYESRKPSVS